jgi:hypothetical protein
MLLDLVGAHVERGVAEQAVEDKTLRPRPAPWPSIAAR